MVSCAAQSPPRPPRVERPQPIRDFAAEQVGGSIGFRFTLPTQAVDEEDLTKPLEIEIFRRIETPGARNSTGQRTPEAGTQSWLSLRPSDLRRQSGGPASYAVQIAPDEFKRLVGDTFRFEVRTLTRGFRRRAIESAPSNLVTLTLLDVPRPVSGIGLQVTERALDLRWAAPAQTLAGNPQGAIASYRVYRSEADSASDTKASPYHLVGEVHETSYSDETFEFGRAYRYRIRAVVAANGTLAESQDSAAVEIVPRDVFPPAVPAGLTGLFTSGAVELLWNPNSEADLGGYNVRRREGQAKPEQLNHELLRSPIYRDTAIAQGHHYSYSVTAVDRSGNESAASSEVDVETQ